MSHPKARNSILLNWLELDRGSETPLYRQIADQIRSALLEGRLSPGDCLPASRALADEIGVSRITTVQAFEQLVGEGIVETRRGSGTRISPSLAPIRPRARAPVSRPLQPPHLQEAHAESTNVAFQPGIPAFDAFPRLRWSRLMHRHASRSDPFLLDYAHMGGYGPLRTQLARYLGAARGLACHPGQVIVVSSTRAAAGLAGSVLWPPGSTVAVEDPGYKVVQRVLIRNGYRLRHVAVDAQGLRVDDLDAENEPSVGVYVTPAHQWPTGHTLTARRRLQLLDWARAGDAWILEDDYDSVFRFGSPAPAPLYAYGSGRVIYIGTFSKTFAPSVRTAYLVVPPEAVLEFERQAFSLGAEPPLHVQAALANLLEEGYFARHVARMRKLYARRRDRLVAALSRAFDDGLTIVCPSGGLQILALLPDGVSDVEVGRRARAVDLVARPISNWSVCAPSRNGLQLGFAAVPEEAIEPGVARLHGAIRDLL